MGNQTEVGGGVGVPESGQGGCKHHQTGNGFFRVIGEGTVLLHQVHAVFHHAEVDVQTGTGFTDGDLRGKRHIQTFLVSQVADDPFCHGQLFCCFLCVHGQKFDLVLFVDQTLEGEVPHFGVTVFDSAAGAGDIVHAELTEFTEFCVGSGFVIAFLVNSGKAAVVFRDHVIFQFAHCLKFQTGGLLECFASLVERVFRGAFQRIAILVEEGAEEVQRGQFTERVHIRRAETGNHIQVAVIGFDEREEAGAVHAFAAGEDLIQIVAVIDDEVQRFQSAVTGGVLEVDMTDPFRHDEINDVFLGEIGGGFPDFFSHGIHAVRCTHGHFSFYCF